MCVLCVCVCVCQEADSDHRPQSDAEADADLDVDCKAEGADVPDVPLSTADTDNTPECLNKALEGLPPRYENTHTHT